MYLQNHIKSHFGCKKKRIWDVLKKNLNNDHDQAARPTLFLRCWSLGGSSFGDCATDVKAWSPNNNHVNG